MRTIIKAYFLLFIIIISIQKVNAQIGAEAQGGKFAIWSALGLDQHLSEKWISVTDIGYGRHGGNDDYHLVSKQGLIVLTQDFFYKVNNHIKFTLSGGYWKRNYYTNSLPQYRNEIRPFSRIYYNHKINTLHISHQLRNDFRFYYTPDFMKWSTPFEYRIRYMLTLKKKLTPLGKSQLIVNDEILASESYLTHSESFDNLKISENRVSCYYRYDLTKTDIDIGVMHQFWRQEANNRFVQSFSFMIDVILKAPFSNKKM